MGQEASTEVTTSLSGTHAELMKSGLIEESNVPPMSRGRAKVVFTLQILFRDEQKVIEEAYVEIATHIGSMVVGRTALPMLAIHDRVGDDFTRDIKKFPSLKSVIVSKTFNFNNMLLVEYCVPIYQAVKNLSSILYSVGDLKAKGILLSTSGIAEKSDKIFIRVDLFKRSSPDAYIVNLIDEYSRFKVAVNNTVLRSSEGPLDMDGLLTVDPRNLASEVDEIIPKIIEAYKPHLMPIAPQQ